MLKKCSKCEQDKPLDEFHKDWRGGHRGRCKICYGEYGRQWRENNPERARELSRLNEKKRRLTKYGLTPERYEEMLKSCCGKCMLCGVKPKTHKGKSESLFVDHDHKTGAVRGLLCGNCNSMLGYAVDSIEVLERAIEYLRKKSAPRL